MHLKDLKLVHELSLKISSVLDISKLMPKIMNAFVEAGRISRGSIMVFDDVSERFLIKASIGLSDRAVKEVRPKIGEGIAGMVAEIKKPILIVNTLQDERYKKFAEDSKRRPPEESLLCLPLVFQKKVLGVVNLQSKADGKPFDEKDEMILSILANSAAVALNNAKLYELIAIDELTGLYVKKYFLSRLDEELGRAKRHFRYTSLILGEIGGLELIERRHGKDIGNKVWINVAKVVKNAVRAADVCARYDAARFAVILVETDGPSALLFAERLKENISMAVKKQEHLDINLAVSLGISISTPRRFMSASEMVVASLKALEEAKAQGGGKTLVNYEQNSV